jgi:phosphoserine phosphatase
MRLFPSLRSLAATAIGCLLALSQAQAQAQGVDLLPSWNDGAAKARIVAFVQAVTEPGGKDFVPPAERIAVFDNDGTLWSEQPVYFQAMFVRDRVIALAPKNPAWKTQEPFASLIKGDMKGVAASGEKGMAALMAATHAGMTTSEFNKSVSDWIATARHPKTGRLLTDMTFQPMKELLAYLRDNGFKTFIVSGGGIEFMRPWTERVYGIPPEQVVGSSGGLKLELRDGKPVLVKLPTVVLNDDKVGKPVGIQRHIGRQPIAAFGNSDGDFEMLAWTTSAPGARLGMLIHHDDAEREFAYDRKSHVGKLDRGLNEAGARGWTVVSMKDDWKTVFAPVK